MIINKFRMPFRRAEKFRLKPTEQTLKTLCSIPKTHETNITKSSYRFFDGNDIQHVIFHLKAKLSRAISLQARPDRSSDLADKKSSGSGTSLISLFNFTSEKPWPARARALLPKRPRDYSYTLIPEWALIFILIYISSSVERPLLLSL